MSDDEEEVSETRFMLIEELHRTQFAFLPQSPAKVYTQAEAMGWEVVAWANVGEYQPALYLHGSEESDPDQHSAGDVKFDGYVAKHFIVEARDPGTRAIGFRAHYAGRIYEDSRKAPLGSFDFAMIADPVGVPTPLSAEYKTIKPSRGDHETEKSYALRVKAVTDRVEWANKFYNDGEFYWPTQKVINAAKEFDAWLAEWRSFQ